MAFMEFEREEIKVGDKRYELKTEKDTGETVVWYGAASKGKYPTKQAALAAVKSGKFSNSFQNGVARATSDLAAKFENAGVRVENDGSTSRRDYKVGDELKLRGRYGVIKKMSDAFVTLDIDGEMYQASWNDPQLKA